MKFRLTFQHHDAVYDATKGVEYSDEEKETMEDGGYEAIKSLLQQYLRWDEHLTVEFDTELGIATVLRQFEI